MKIRRTSSPSFASEDVDLGTSPAKLELDEINDHPREQSRRQNSAYRHQNMKGAFGNEGALRFCLRKRSWIDQTLRLSQDATNAHGLADRSIPVSFLQPRNQTNRRT